MPPRRRTVRASQRDDAAPAAATGSAARPGRRRRAAAATGSTGPGAGRDVEAVGQFIERFAGILFEFGIPRMPARVFVALLTAESDRLTAADLGAILGVSPAAVSGAVRYLIQVGLVSGAGVPGSRRLFYSVPRDVWQQLLSLRNATMARWMDTLREGVELVGGDTPAGQRMTESVRYFEFVAAELPGALGRWAARRAALDDQE